jgi:hypothetical protein
VGQGTTDLALRVGLNSGPTTAGVLRGEKARFQLFGDVSREMFQCCLCNHVIIDHYFTVNRVFLNNILYYH